MDQESKFVVLGRELAELHVDFESMSDEFLKLWRAKFQNSNLALLAAIYSADENTRAVFLAEVYRVAAQDMFNKSSLERLNRLTFYDWNEITQYGQMLLKIRFSLGYLGNMRQGDLASAEHCEALIFAYEAYWKFGDDYLLGSIVKEYLEDVLDYGGWDWPKDSKFKGQEKLRQFQNLGYAIKDQFKSLKLFHHISFFRLHQNEPRISGKPEFKDFEQY